MFVLSWRITLAALILLPLFVLARPLLGTQAASHHPRNHDLTAAMNNLMVERFNVAGALLAKLFGRPLTDASSFEEKAARVSDIGVNQALYGRIFSSALVVVATCATALAYGWGGVLAVRHRSTSAPWSHWSRTWRASMLRCLAFRMCKSAS